MEYTFDTFIVGKSNRLAYMVAMEVVTNLGHTGNPLFIYSGVGTGKTHLLHAMVMMFCRKTTSVCYML